MILLQGATAGSSNRGHFCPANDDDSCYVSGVYVVNTYFIFVLSPAISRRCFQAVIKIHKNFLLKHLNFLDMQFSVWSCL